MDPGNFTDKLHGAPPSTEVSPTQIQPGQKTTTTITPPPDHAKQQEKTTTEVVNGAQQRSQEKGIPSETTKVIGELIEYGHFEQAGQAINGGDKLSAKAFVEISELENIVSDFEKDPLDEALADLAEDGFVAPETATKKMSEKELMQELGLAEKDSTDIKNKVLDEPDKEPSSNINPQMQKNFQAAHAALPKDKLATSEELPTITPKEGDVTPANVGKKETTLNPKAAGKSLKEPQKPTIKKVTSEEADYLKKANSLLEDPLGEPIGLNGEENASIDKDGYFNGEVFDENYNVVRYEHNTEKGTYEVSVRDPGGRLLKLESFAKDGTMTTTTYGSGPERKETTKQPDQHFGLLSSGPELISKERLDMLNKAQSLLNNRTRTDESYINPDGFFIGAIYASDEETITYSMDKDGNYIVRSDFEDGTSTITTLKKDGSNTTEKKITIDNKEYEILNQEKSSSGETLTEYLISTDSKGGKKVGRIYEWENGSQTHNHVTVSPSGKKKSLKTIFSKQFNHDKNQWEIKDHQKKSMSIQTPQDAMLGMSVKKKRIKGSPTSKYLDHNGKKISKNAYERLQNRFAKIAKLNPDFNADQIKEKYTQLQKKNNWK